MLIISLKSTTNMRMLNCAEKKTLKKYYETIEFRNA